MSQAERLLDDATLVLRAGPWFLSLALSSCHPCGAAGERRRSIALCAKVSRSSAELHDNFAFVYALVPLAAAAASRAMRPGRRGFWALATRLPNGRVRQLSTRGGRPQGTGRTRAACPPRPGPVGRGVCGRTHDVHRCAAEGDRRRRANGMLIVRQEPARRVPGVARKGLGTNVAHARRAPAAQRRSASCGTEARTAAAPGSRTRSAPMRAGSVRVAGPAAHR